MFNDKYGLTQAVLDGKKTMTRRIIKTPRTMEGKDVYGFSVVKYPRTIPIEVMALDADGAQINNILPKYKVGEVVAVAQSYKNLVLGKHEDREIDLEIMRETPGWNNKMFVSSELMPHQIRITNVRVERLQDISDEDCLREGVMSGCKIYMDSADRECYGPTIYAIDYCDEDFSTPQSAFAALIDKVSGRGTWADNPWVFVYEFELVK